MTEQKLEIESALMEAYNSAFEAARENPTTANRDTYRRAKKALEKFFESSKEPELVFRSITEMVDWLDARGWKIGQSTAYEHRDQGKLKLRADGTITESMAIEYAGGFLKKKDGTPGRPTGVSLQQEKIAEEIGLKRADRRMRELKVRAAEGELIPRSQVEIEFSERAMNLKAYLEAVARASSGRIIKIVGGDIQKSSELIAFLLGLVRKALDNYSRPIKGFEEDIDQ